MLRRLAFSLGLALGGCALGSAPARAAERAEGPGHAAPAVAGHGTEQSAGGVEPTEDSSDAPGTEWITFSAGRIEGETDLRELVLADDVVVTAGRYRLTSDRLELEQTSRGLAVEGPGRVAFCPCPRPPISLGFRRVLAAPPTDLLVTSPTLRVGDVPVLWVPFLWIRSPDRAGLLPPEVSWRTEEGVLLGSGIHLPFGAQRVDGQRRYVDLRGAAYLGGGGALDVGLLGHRAAARLRWDHRRESLLLLEARGAHPALRNAVLAYDVDAIRGARGRRGTLELEPASRRYDRALVSVWRADASTTLGLGVRAVARRGGHLDEVGVAGPSAHLAVASALSRSATASLSVDSGTLRDDEHGSVSVVRQQGESTVATRAGPFGLDLVAGERALVVATEVQERVSAMVGGRARCRLPLVRTFGGGADPLVHRVEPYAALAGETSTVRGPYYAWAEPEGRGELLGVELGASSTAGRRVGPGAAELTAALGWAGEPAAGSAYAGARGLVTYRSAGLGGEAYVVPEHPGNAVSAVHFRLQAASGPWFGGHAEGRRGVEPAVARFLASRGSEWSRVGWFDTEGLTVGGAAGVPWARWLASSLGADLDLEHESVLAIRGATAYRHPCGCLAVVASAGHRLGRDGIDAWLAVDLAP